MAEFCSQYIPILYCLNILTSQTLSSNVDVKVDVQLEAQFINLTLSMDLNKLFADLPSKYADLVEISRLKSWTTDDDLVDLPVLKEKMQNRLQQAQKASSAIRFASELSNTPSFNQHFLRDAACSDIDTMNITDGKGYTIVYGAPPDITFSQDTSFRYYNKVNTQYSQVILPTDVHYCLAEPKKDILWTSSLNEPYIETASKYPLVDYMYFATPSGAVRLYPATEVYQPITYDVRFQQSYAQSITLPKMVLIAIDSSGSVNGEVIVTIENTLNNILETLSDSDQLAICYFKNDFVRLLPSDAELDDICPDSEGLWFVPATNQNKQAFKNVIFLHTNNNATADFEMMFDEASAIFDRMPADQICLKYLIVLTDGGKGAGTEAGHGLNRLLEAHPEVRLAYFLEGKEAFQSENVDLWVLPCSANGYFYKVFYEEEVRSSVADLVGIMSRATIVNNVTYGRWSNLHTKPWDSNYGPVMTIGFPVYNTSDPNITTVLGVSSCDVHVLKFLLDSGSARCPLDGDLLLLNSKGSVVFEESLGTLLQLFPINPNMLSFPELNQKDFFNDVNVEQEILELDEEILSTEGSKQIVPQVIDTPDVQYVVPVEEVRYTWTRLTLGTSAEEGDDEFTLLQRRPILEESGSARLTPEIDLDNENTRADALFDSDKATSARQMFYLQFSQPVQNLLDSSLYPNVKLYFSSENYCPGIDVSLKGQTANEMFSFLDINVFQSNQYPYVDGCKQNPGYWNLLYDLYFIYQYFSNISSNWVDMGGHELGSSFVKFSSGILMVRESQSPKASLGLAQMWETLRNNNAAVTTATNSFAEPNPAQIRVGYNYRYEDESKEGTCYRGGNTYWQYDSLTYEFPALGSRRVTYRDPESNLSVPFAVAGFIHSREVLWAYRMAFLFDKCNIIEGRICYFLDEGGFIIASSAETRPSVPEELQNKYAIGANLYSKDPCLMQQLVHDGIYKQVEVLKPTCACPPRDIFSESSCETISNILKTLLALFWTLFQALTQVSIPSINSFAAMFFAPSLVEPLQIKFPERHVCQVKVIKFHLGTKTETSGVQTNCSSTCACAKFKQYYATKVASSNWVLVSILNDNEVQCEKCNHLHNSRISLTDEFHRFEDKQGRSIRKNGQPVQEYKINTCDYKPRAEKSQQRGCFDSYDEEKNLYCNQCNLKSVIGPKNVVIMTLFSCILTFF